MKKPFKYRETLNKLARSPRAPFLALWLVLTVCHLMFRITGGDELYYAAVFGGEGLYGFLVRAYGNWSSRTVIEAVLCVVAALPRLVWRLVNPLMGVICAAGISRIIGAKNTPRTNWAVCGFMLLYQWQYLSTAGWVATTVNYLWPAALAMPCAVCAAMLVRGEKPAPARCALSTACLFFSANMEQLAALLLLCIASVIVWLLCKKRAVHWMLWAQLGVVVIGLLWFLASPGVRVRTYLEEASWYPNFGMRSVLANMELGLSSTLSSVLFRRNFVFFFLLVLMAWVVFLRSKNVFYRMLAAAPLCVCAVLGMYGRYFTAWFPALNFFTQAVDGGGSIGLANASVPQSYLPFLLLCGCFALVLVGVYIAAGHTPAALMAVLGLLYGFGSQVLMGFSPTVWASGERTGFYFSLCCMAAACWLFAQTQTARRWQRTAFGVLFGAYCALQIYSMAEMRISTGYM